MRGLTPETWRERTIGSPIEIPLGILTLWEMEVRIAQFGFLSKKHIMRITNWIFNRKPLQITATLEITTVTRVWRLGTLACFQESSSPDDTVDDGDTYSSAGGVVYVVVVAVVSYVVVSSTEIIFDPLEEEEEAAVWFQQPELYMWK